ncbi:phytanoyl-CoA dioxygenase family protein [Paenibacillus sp. GCM10027626]|uniref:phytanoyl-CoA dioxygenase family protein n=1 Tax=Paenibacillus sp. GCM10027626 TaxID=3273411 RepID=UPI0036365268
MTSTYKEQFDRDGYVVMKNLFSDHEAVRLKEEAGKVLQEKGVGKEGVYVGMAAASPVFAAAAAKRELVTVLRELIGEKVVFLSDKIVFKNASTDFGSPWHQDYPYWEGSHKYSVWIALDDANPDNGCLRVVPGSHLLGDVRHSGDTSDGLGFGNRLSQDNIDESQVVDLAASQGDAIIFHDFLFHASYPNTSGKDRWALISTYKDGAQEDPAYSWAIAAFTVTGSGI